MALKGFLDQLDMRRKRRSHDCCLTYAYRSPMQEFYDLVALGCIMSSVWCRFPSRHTAASELTDFLFGPAGL